MFLNSAVFDMFHVTMQLTNSVTNSKTYLIFGFADMTERSNAADSHEQATFREIVILLAYSPSSDI